MKAPLFHHIDLSFHIIDMQTDLQTVSLTCALPNRRDSQARPSRSPQPKLRPQAGKRDRSQQRPTLGLGPQPQAPAALKAGLCSKSAT